MDIELFLRRDELRWEILSGFISSFSFNNVLFPDETLQEYLVGVY